MTDVFVRGSALCSALGADLEHATERLLSGTRHEQLASVAGWPYCAVAAEEGDWESRAERIARAVALDLRARAELNSTQWSELPCIVGSSSYSVGMHDGRAETLPQAPLAFCRKLAGWFGVNGPVMAAATACTSGLSAIDVARGLIETGVYRYVLVLGVELRNPLTVAGFAGLNLLSRTAARPCDRMRDGLVLGEALGAVLLSAERGEWRLASLAVGTDAASLTGPQPGGDVIAEVMREAMRHAQWSAMSVDAVKLQAGGSPLTDLAEAHAVRALFDRMPTLVSLKGALGHTLGASAQAELALLLACVARGRVPDTWGFEHPDDDGGLSPKGAAANGVRRILFNLSGFGGNVMTLALERSG
jgi:3-oxoacyl-[acyl-carrier-protein] synthase-1